MGAATHKYQNFVKCYEQGRPEEDYLDREVLNHYSTVAHEAFSVDYEEAVRESISRLTPEQRARSRVVSMFRGRRRIRRMALISVDSHFGWLSNVTWQLHQQPGLLREIFGGLGDNSSDSVLANPVAKTALARITATLVKRAMRRDEKTNARCISNCRAVSGRWKIKANTRLVSPA
jgi:hypothetical protein